MKYKPTAERVRFADRLRKHVNKEYAVKSGKYENYMTLIKDAKDTLTYFSRVDSDYMRSLLNRLDGYVLVIDLDGQDYFIEKRVDNV